MRPDQSPNSRQQLIGDWAQGIVPERLFDPASEQWSTVGTDGFLWRFSDHGSYEYMGTLSVGTMTIASYERGGASFEPDTFTVEPQDRWVLQPDGTTKKHKEHDLDPRTYKWRLVNSLGETQLLLEGPDGKPDTFYRR